MVGPLAGIVAAEPGADDAPGGGRRPARPRIAARRSYSRFVGMMKVVLPLAAGILVLMVVIWPNLYGEKSGFRLGVARFPVGEGGGQRLVNARFTGVDSDNRPYVITAAAAIQPDAATEAVALERPAADISLADGTWIALTADRGRYQRTDKRLELSGTVNLFHDKGYEFNTTEAVIDLDRGTASGSAPIAGQGPFGQLRAAGFQVLERGARVIFTGKAALTLYPARREKTP
jgi:lipopolysaccharide export system protein LptC